jgi:hypothetical protein
MSFNGKATYDGGASLPELARDIADIVGLISPHETPLLDAIGAPRAPARSIRHEWLEDSLSPLSTRINDAGGYDDEDTVLTVDDGTVFRDGDLVRPVGSDEVMQVTESDATTVTVVRGYGDTTAAALVDNQELVVIGHAALEGEDAAAAIARVRTLQVNYSQIFTETVSVSGSMDAASLNGVEREFDYQVIARTRELMRQLEQSVIAGVQHAATPGGSASVRRTMGGLLGMISGTNAVVQAASGAALTEDMVNNAMRACWEKGGRPGVLVCNGFQKRKISGFVTSTTQYTEGENRLKSLIDVYETDFGTVRVILSRWVPQDKVLLLDLDRIQVMPLAGRSFHVKPLAATGDFRRAQVIGEYTLEALNAGDGGHGVITGLATA